MHFDPCCSFSELLPRRSAVARLFRCCVSWSWAWLTEIFASEQSEQQGSKCRASCFIRSSMTSRPHRLKKTSSMQSKRRDLHHTWLHRETYEKLSFYCYSPRWITTTFSTGRKLEIKGRKSCLLKIGTNSLINETIGFWPVRGRVTCNYQRNLHV